MITKTLEDETAAVAKREIAPPNVCPICLHKVSKELLRAPDRFHGRAEIYRLRRCENCSVVWLEDPPSPENMGMHYGPDYDRSVANAGMDPDRWKGRREDLLKYKTGGALLDLGCSSGGFLSTMKGPSWNLHGIEMSEDVARKAESSSGAKVFVGDILDAPYAPESFDAITCFHVFEHIYYPREVLAKVFEWLKPGGVFYAFMPNIDSAGGRIFGSYWYALELPRHLFHYSSTSLRKIAGSVGLEEVSITTKREVFIESSVRYILDAVCHNVGIDRLPLARAKKPSTAFRVVRKACRLTAIPILNTMAAVAGDGESIHAIFTKKAAK
jgi:SAM-dependent methyltransferase